MKYKDKKVESSSILSPDVFEITPTAIYIRTNIEAVDDKDREGITYTYLESKYSKDGYIKKQQELLDEQEAMLIDIDFRLTTKEAEELL